MNCFADEWLNRYKKIEKDRPVFSPTGTNIKLCEVAEHQGKAGIKFTMVHEWLSAEDVKNLYHFLGKNFNLIPTIKDEEPNKGEDNEK